MQWAVRITAAVWESCDWWEKGEVYIFLDWQWTNLDWIAAHMRLPQTTPRAQYIYNWKPFRWIKKVIRVPPPNNDKSKQVCSTQQPWRERKSFFIYVVAVFCKTRVNSFFLLHKRLEWHNERQIATCTFVNTNTDDSAFLSLNCKLSAILQSWYTSTLTDIKIQKWIQLRNNLTSQLSIIFSLNITAVFTAYRNTAAIENLTFFTTGLQLCIQLF